MIVKTVQLIEKNSAAYKKKNSEKVINNTLNVANQIILFTVEVVHAEQDIDFQRLCRFLRICWGNN